jgi:uncharacterized membrane-anchored protein
MPRKVLLFLLVALAQLAVPAWMLIGHERVRSEGEVFKFRTAPVDPRDPFRGEYVSLSFEAETGHWPLPHENDGSSARIHAYAVLAKDTEDFATITALVPERPSAGAYISVEFMAWETDTIFNIRLPFDRYYLEEGDGPKTEALLATQWNDGVPTQPLPAYAVVRVLDGATVITDLIVDDKSIHEWLKEEPRSAPEALPEPEPTSAPSGS